MWGSSRKRPVSPWGQSNPSPLPTPNPRLCRGGLQFILRSEGPVPASAASAPPHLGNHPRVSSQACLPQAGVARLARRGGDLLLSDARVGARYIVPVRRHFERGETAQARHFERSENSAPSRGVHAMKSLFAFVEAGRNSPRPGREPGSSFSLATVFRFLVYPARHSPVLFTVDGRPSGRRHAARRDSGTEEIIRKRPVCPPGFRSSKRRVLRIAETCYLIGQL